MSHPIHFVCTAASLEKQPTDCAIVGVFSGNRLTPSAAALDQESHGALAALLKRGDLDADRPGKTLLLHQVSGIPAARVLLVGLGKARELDGRGYRQALGAVFAVLRDLGVASASLALGEAAVRGRDAAWKAEQAVLLAGEALYRFDKTKAAKAAKTHKADAKDGKKAALRQVKVPTARGERPAVDAALKRGMAIVGGMNLARDLGNLPANLCTPTVLAEQAVSLAGRCGFSVEVLERKAIERLGMGSFLSVAKGSDEPPKFIVLRSMAAGNDKPIVLIGKGITFDSGGITLKPGLDMDEMKYDMSGAAAVLGVFHAIAELGLPLNVVGLIPTCENLPSGRANKPGDVVTSMSGQTIEILNTDAEGRLILCDALTYAERFEPAAVVDIATLTGACVIALGHVTSGLLGNDDALIRELLRAGETAADPCWQMPLFEEYQELLHSNFADMANIGGRPGATITAAAFLSRFAGKFKWAHLDIAGTAARSGKEKGSTGRPVPLLLHFLTGRAARG